MALDIPLPTQSVYDDADQYIPLLLSAVEGFLLSRDIWGINEYDDARLYMNDLMKFIVEYFGASAMGQTPVGALMEWVMPTPPPRWLICNGASVLKASYVELFALFGAKYGTDATHFSLPDFVNRSPYGAGGTLALDAVTGAENHTLTTAQLPVHNHALTDPGHTHPLSNRASGTTSGTINRISSPVNSTAATNAVVDSNTTGVTIANAGSGSSHNNLHPVRGVHVIVYAGKT